MPIKFVTRLIALEHGGVTVYHTYRESDFDDPRAYIYGHAEDCNDTGEDHFDIRDLLNYGKDKTHDDILREAIDKGYLTQTGVYL